MRGTIVVGMWLYPVPLSLSSCWDVHLSSLGMVTHPAVGHHSPPLAVSRALEGRCQAKVITAVQTSTSTNYWWLVVWDCFPNVLGSWLIEL